MPKIKTHKGTSDRIKTTKTGKLLRRRAFSNHFLQKKSASRKRKYAGVTKVSSTQEKTAKRNLGA